MPDDTSELKYIESVNSQAPLPQKMLASMKHRRELYHKTIAERFDAQRLLKSTDEELNLRQRLRAAVLHTAGSADSIERLKRERKARFDKALELQKKLKQMEPSFITLDRGPLDANGIGTLWWASTSVSTTSPTAGALVVFFQDGVLRFGGNIEVQSEDLQYASIHVFAQFGLGPDRMPAGFNFVSNPFLNIFGGIDGAVFPSFFDFGDQWSKCWLNMSQSVLTPVNFGGIPSNVILGSNSQSAALIFIESNFGIATQHYSFPGFTGLPTVNFPMYDFARTNGIEIDLAINLDMQLVGDQSLLLFRTNGDTDSLQTFQWDLQPA